MRIEVGLRDITITRPDGTKYVEDGEFITVIELPDGMSLEETIATTIGAIQAHAGSPDRAPAWVDCAAEALSNALSRHYQLMKRTRPQTWGNEGKSTS